MDRPDPGAARVGQVISVKGKLLRRNGIALRESAGTVLVLLKGDETLDLPTAEFDAAKAAKPVEVPGPPVGGAAGRLWKALRALQVNQLDGKWNPQQVMNAAQAHATASTGARRAAALDALTLGAPDLLRSLGLTPSEVAWYQARSAAGTADTATTLGWLEQLPAHGYALRVPMLLALSADLLRDASLGARAAAQVAPFAAADLDARALHAALARPGTADVITPLVPLAVAAEGTDGQLAEWAAAIAAAERPARPFPNGLPVTAALDSYLRFRAGVPYTSTVDILRWLPLPLLDEMIDRGAVPPVLAGQPGWPERTVAYVRSRLDPGGTPLADLTAAGFTAELARRHYLSEDAAALDALPAENEAVRHYRALAAWRTGTGRPGLDGLRPEARLVLGQVAEVRAAVAAGQDAALTETIAADPTSWPLLWQGALQGALRLPGPLAGRYPRFAEWLALCGIQRLLFQSRWDDAVGAGRALAERTQLEVTSDEALNMVAFAELQLGKPATALQTLDTALGGRFTTGLLVNASVVAASQGSVAAIPYLARITSDEQDPAVRAVAVERAVDLWRQDDLSPEYPQELRALVRAALGQPQPDELHKTLVQVAAGQDREWLAGDGTVRSGNPGQAAWTKYQRAWARRKTDGSQEGLVDIANVLVELAKSPSPPDWVATELRQLTKNLDELVHVDFGDTSAVVLTPAIEALVAGDVLELTYRIVLAAQAATHTAFFLAEENGCVTPEYEQRMLFSAVRLYQQRKEELPESDREYAADQLAMCVGVTGFAVRVGLVNFWDDATKRFNLLVERMSYASDYVQQDKIMRQKGDILNRELDPLPRRLRSYLALLSELPLDDRARETQRQITETVTEMEAEIARLRPSTR
jgi:hypothetical protein